MAWSDFFQPQTHLPQHLPQTADAHMHRNSRLQLLLQLCQGQVGLNLDPAAQSLLYLGVTLRRDPRRCSIRSICPLCLRCAEIFHAHGKLTEKRVAS